MTRLACGQPDWNHSAALCRQGCAEWPTAPSTHEFVTDDGIHCVHCNGYPYDVLHWTIARIARPTET